MYEVVIEGPEVDIVEKIKKARSKDEDCYEYSDTNNFLFFSFILFYFF